MGVWMKTRVFRGVYQSPWGWGLQATHSSILLGVRDLNSITGPAGRDTHSRHALSHTGGGGPTCSWDLTRPGVLQQKVLKVGAILPGQAPQGSESGARRGQGEPCPRIPKQRGAVRRAAHSLSSVLISFP